MKASKKEALAALRRGDKAAFASITAELAGVKASLARADELRRELRDQVRAEQQAPAASARKRVAGKAVTKPQPPAPRTADETAFLQALRSFAASEPPGALLSVRDFRGQLPGWSKARFDKVALALSEANVVVLLHHDHPASVPAADLVRYVFDPAGFGGRGIYYNGIAMRRGAS
ncbi:hypothetical protein [Chondromyces apiculatus]|uniref:hypothetical protein n=1 Tax=Chondromyces apiculatus TaxID=51 RepID=UPI0005C50CF7|nr:hypothetical protein [Chondromyces apiculatus]